MINAGYNNPKSLHVGMDDFRHIYQCVYDTLFPPIDGEDEEEDDLFEGESQHSGGLLSRGGSPLKSLELEEEDEEGFGSGKSPMNRGSPSGATPLVGLSSSSQLLGPGSGLEQASAPGQGLVSGQKNAQMAQKTPLSKKSSGDDSQREGVRKASYWDTPSGKATVTGL